MLALYYIIYNINSATYNNFSALYCAPAILSHSHLLPFFYSQNILAQYRLYIGYN